MQRILTRGVLIVLALLFGGNLARADDYCEICKAKILGTMYLYKDRYHNKSLLACKACTLLTTRCLICDVPVPAQSGLALPDGRIYCPEDAKMAVMTEEAATAQFAKGRQEVMDLLAPYPPLPQQNIETHLVTREQFNAQYRRTPGIDDPTRLLGLTISRKADDGKLIHDIYLLHGVPEEEFLAVCAHEYTHAWLDEREKKNTSIAQGYDRRILRICSL